MNNGQTWVAAMMAAAVSAMGAAAFANSHAATTVTVGNARFTLLTDRMVRCEWSADGTFEDRPSLVFVNREMPKVEYTLERRSDGAKPEVSLDRIDRINKIGKTANDNPVNPVNPVQENSATPRLCVRIPLADGNPDSRVYAYEVVVIAEAGSQKLFKAVYAAGCNMGIGHEPNKGVTTLEIAASELPPGETLTVAVRPLTSLGTAGRPIITDFKV